MEEADLSEKPPTGSYAEVVGWISDPVDMGEYSDFNMIVPKTCESAAGICHARGVNANLPAGAVAALYQVAD
jgi:hypothetical protein